MGLQSVAYLTDRLRMVNKVLLSHLMFLGGFI